MELDGIVEVSIIIGDIVGDVQISAGIGASCNCLSWVSNWTVASEVDGEAGVSFVCGSSMGSGGSSSSTSVNVVIDVFMSY